MPPQTPEHERDQPATSAPGLTGEEATKAARPVYAETPTVHMSDPHADTTDQSGVPNSETPTVMSPASSVAAAKETMAELAAPTQQAVPGTDPTVVGDLAPAASGEGEVDLKAKILKRMAESDAAEARPKVDPLIGQELGGRFTVTEKIGEGGMGAVYRARQKNMDRNVAIKVLLRSMSENETVVRRFSLEALAVSKLKHPHTIQIFDFGETNDGQLYIAMEFLDGQPLDRVMALEGALAPLRALRIAAQVAKSLREAHAKGIVHRDLKPENIFLVTIGEDPDFVKVLDFGVAKLREGDEKQATLTKAGAVFGTPRYMSPEQGMSSGNVDQRSDVYAIGVILFEMLTARPPFQADSALGILIQHMQEPVPAFAEVRPDLVIPPEVEAITRRLLEKQPDDRPQTAEALIRELEGLEEGLDDIFRRVVTCEFAEELGLEVQRAQPTQADTHLVTKTGQGLKTVGTDAAETLYAEPAARKPKWGKRLAIAFTVLLLLGGGGAGVLHAMLEPLPDTYRNQQGRLAVLGSPESGGIASLAGVEPIPDLDWVKMSIDSEPAGAEVWADGQRLGTTPYQFDRVREDRTVPYRVQQEGYLPSIVLFKHTTDRSEKVVLDPKPVIPPTPVPPLPEAKVDDPKPKPKPKAEDPKPKPEPKPKAEDPKPKPEPKPKEDKPKPKPKEDPFKKKVDDLKAKDPFGRKKRGRKKDPFKRRL